MTEEKQLVVLQEIDREDGKVVGFGRTANGRPVEFSLDETQLVGIVRLLTIVDGASIWVDGASLRPPTPPPASPRKRGKAAKRAEAEPEREREQEPGDLPARIAVILPEPFLQQLVAVALDARGLAVVLDTPEGILRRFEGRDRPTAVVLDVISNGGQNGVALMRRIRAIRPETSFVFLSRLPDARFVGEELRPDRRIAYLRLDATPDPSRVVTAVETVLARRSGPLWRDDLRADRPLGMLSNRQLWLLSQLSRGLLLSEIAQSRGVSERGAQRLLSRTYERLGIKARGATGHARSLAVRRFCDAAGMAPVALPEVDLTEAALA